MTRELLTASRRLIATFSLCVVGLCFPGGSTNAVAADETHGSAKIAPASEDFKAQTSLFLRKYCADCHGVDTQEAGIRFDRLGHDMPAPETAQIWNNIFAQVQFSEMPPADADQPAAKSKTRFLKLAEDELMRFGAGFGPQKRC